MTDKARTGKKSRKTLYLKSSGKDCSHKEQLSLAAVARLRSMTRVRSKRWKHRGVFYRRGLQRVFDRTEARYPTFSGASLFEKTGRGDRSGDLKVMSRSAHRSTSRNAPTLHAAKFTGKENGRRGSTSVKDTTLQSSEGT